MGNAIPTRIMGFLKRYPPFSLIKDYELMTISEKVIVKYLRPGEEIFHQGEVPGNFIYVVRDGAIQLLKNENGLQILADVCDEGDLFGLRPVMAEDNYLLSAIAEEESLVYAVNIKTLKPIIDLNPEVASYLARSFASGKYDQINRRLQKDHRKLIPNRNEEINLEEIQTIDHSKAPVTCKPDTIISDAAKKMRDSNVGSIIVINGQFHPQGIITDRDLRNRVVTGEIGLNDSVSELMSSPVVTIPPGLTIADVQMLMMQYNIHHLCITESGNCNSRIIGIISEHDLLVLQGRNPAVLVKEIGRNNDLSELKQIIEKSEDLLHKYLDQDVSINFISKIMTRIHDALLVKAIQLSEMELRNEGIEIPELKWCWLAIGSGGRGEQLIRTDQDNAIVFEDVKEEGLLHPRQYFLSLAKKVVDILEYCGFEYCPAEMMASNPKWCLSLTEWKSQFSSWIHKPTEQNIMLSSIFFDFRLVYGDKSLTKKLSKHIIEEVDPDSMFAVNLAKNAIRNPPPLTFFRNFMVEKNGEHQDEFDIKARAMMPLVDAARILILTCGRPDINNTVERFEVLAEIEPQNRELYQQAADAFEILLRYRAIQGLQHHNTGRYIDPSSLSKMERLNLRNCFKPTSKLQELLLIRFRVSMFL